jgi:hypothetical protein
MLAIANKCAMAEEATIETRESKKDKNPNHTVRTGTSMSNDKTRKPNHSVANIE